MLNTSNAATRLEKVRATWVGNAEMCSQHRGHIFDEIQTFVDEDDGDAHLANLLRDCLTVAELLKDAPSDLKDLLKEVKRLRGVIAGFYDAIKHGDDGHQKWLKDKINSYLGADGA